MTVTKAEFGGEPAGDRPLIEELEALIVIDSDGHEGLGVVYVQGDEGVERRVSFVGPVGGGVVDMLHELADEIRPPHGGRLEWRRFRA